MTGYTVGAVTVHHGDCLDVLREMPDASVDAVVTDPPYGLEFMGKEWDSFRPASAHAAARTRRADELDDPSKGRYLRHAVNAYVAGPSFQQWCRLWATECLRVLKPGGHLLAFGGTRTSHRLASGIEDAGFEIRDALVWLYGSGFPKSLDVGKAIDRAAGATREIVGKGRRSQNRSDGWDRPWMREQMAALGGSGMAEHDLSAPATDDARRWNGWGTALKPGHEPIVLARKPLTGTVAANVLAHGTGALNIDGCRVGAVGRPRIQSRSELAHSVYGDGLNGSNAAGTTDLGRWPANVVLDDAAAAMLDQQSGETTSTRSAGRNGADAAVATYGLLRTADGVRGHDDAGGASRFYYTAKAGTSERPTHHGDGDGQRVAHPTVKPLDLMRWLVRLITPPGGIVLDPFAGSGTTGEACLLEGVRCVLIERETDYLPLIRQRLDRRLDPVAHTTATRRPDDQPDLFTLLDGQDTP